MGNSLGCSASGERLVSAARDGDLLEARMLLDFNPCLAKYSTFGGLNSPLHFAAAKGHNEIVMLLLDHGADVNSKNYCGQTALMQACRCGHWEVVQTLMLFRCNVFGADYLNGRTALHFAAAGGHARCLRLVVADFVPSISFDPVSFTGDFTSEDGVGSHLGPKYNKHSLAKFLNKQADGGITALHMAALNGYFDCVQLLLDLNADVSAVTFHHGSAMNLIGGGSSPLHYSACGGNLKCCQLLLVKGASRLALNCNGWLPVDVARIWGRHWLEPLLSPQSEQPLPVFSTSNYLSLPLLSILNIARDYGLTVSSAPHDDINVCAVCLERACAVASAGCSHELCINCALYLCSSSTSSVSSEIVVTPGSVPCPLCRHGIVEFIKLQSMPAEDFKLNHTLSLCNPCILNISDLDPPETCSTSTNTGTTYRRGSTVSSRVNCTVSCTPFPSVMIPLCSRDADPCPFELEGEQQGLSLGPSQPQSTANKTNKSDPGMGKTTCSRIFWNRRSCQREQQCNSEINI